MLLLAQDFAQDVHVAPALEPQERLRAPTGSRPPLPTGSGFQDWVAHNLDAWLNTWVEKHAADIAANSYGFTGAFATWAIGNPDFSCRDDGSSSACDFNPCDIEMLNNKGPEIREAYYVMESLNRIHAYFMGLREGFTVSAIGAALSKENWASTFYRDKDNKQVNALKQALSAIQIVIGIGTAVASVANPLDNTFKKAADLGGILGQMVVGAIQNFTSANNLLMKGGNYEGSGDLRDYFKGGAFVAFPGVDKNAVTDAMNGFLIGHAINQLYRQQKIFILGGSACGIDEGVGLGPGDNMICRDVTPHQWGWVAPPPGADQLGKGPYAAVTVQDLINSSLDAYIVAGYNYNTDTATQRVETALKEQWGNPGAQGPSWEGTFTIPVCNVSAMIDADVFGKRYILEQYSHDNRPYWCGPICNGDLETTKAFIHAANMDNFQSPKQECRKDPGY
ncbi:MAG: hypothetical protein Q9217_002569 [Psora testacea]